jgi:hypothetical protein
MPEARLRRLVAAKKIPHYYDGRLFFLSDELDAWLQQHSRPVADPPSSRPAGQAPRLAAPITLADLMPKKRRLRTGGQ